MTNYKIYFLQTVLNNMAATKCLLVAIILSIFVTEGFTFKLRSLERETAGKILFYLITVPKRTSLC